MIALGSSEEELVLALATKRGLSVDLVRGVALGIAAERRILGGLVDEEALLGVREWLARALREVFDPDVDAEPTERLFERVFELLERFRPTTEAVDLKVAWVELVDTLEVLEDRARSSRSKERDAHAA